MATEIFYNLSNCACCEFVCPQIANEPQEKILHSRLRIGGQTTQLPDVVWNSAGGTFGSWQWAAGGIPNLVLIVNSSIASKEDQIDVVDATELTCGEVDAPFGLPAAGLNVRNSAGTFLTLSSTNLASIYDPGPGSFKITYNFGDTAGLGFTFTTSDLELEFYDDAYLP